MRTIRWSVGLSLALLIAVSTSLHADFIFLKDGFVLQGRLIKEYQNVTDPSGFQLQLSKLGGFYFVDDSIRRTYFPASMWASSDSLDRKLQQDITYFRPNHIQWHPQNPALKAFVVNKIGDWQPDGSRTQDINSKSAKGEIQIDQVVDKLTPVAMEVITKRYTGTRSNFFTKEFEPEKVLAMLRFRIKAEVLEQKREVTFDDRIRVARFATQADWHEQALAELDNIAKLHPSELPKLNDMRQGIKRVQLKQKLEEVDDAIASGQHSNAQNMLTSLDQEVGDTEDQTKISTLRNKYKGQNAELERVRKMLAQARQGAATSKLNSLGSSILEEIERDLNLDNMKNLSVFLKLAEQEERFNARKQPANLTPEQLLALAVTGWMQGTEAADQSKEAAEKLITARLFVQQFLVTDDNVERQRLLQEYLSKSSPKADELVQLIDQMPPPRPEVTTKSILDLTSASSKLWREGVKYRVYLPPEYHHHRIYPVLFVIPNLGETYETTTFGWLETAARKGFLVVVPEWTQGKQDANGSSDKEHEAVLETLRDLRRRFRIDNNRVSLAGYSNGGSLVFDVALTRPHLFASAAIISGQMPNDMEKLRYNAQYLPFYVVDANKNPFREKLGPGKRDALMTLFEYWIPKGYPSLYVEYQGRGFEHFHAEKPIIVDWMSRKKRASALPDLGKADASGNRMGQEFRILRPSATRFYWVEVGDHQPTAQSPTLISAGWEKEYPNSLRCVMTGMKKARIWLNSSMVNFENPVEIRLQGPPGSVWESKFKKKLEPSVAVLLEDYYQRGDSKNLFTQYVDFHFNR